MWGIETGDSKTKGKIYGSLPKCSYRTPQNSILDANLKSGVVFYY